MQSEKNVILEESNQELKKTNRRLTQEIRILQQRQDEQEHASKILNWIAMGLALASIILQLSKGLL